MLVKTKFVRRSVRRAGVRRCVFLVVAAVSVIAVAQPVQPDTAVPVTVTKAVRQDVPIWLNGLGTVQANYAVQLRPRVDGTLTQVPVKEGQGVKQGDLLAVIDPRPYQAALDAAVAKKQQDQAQTFERAGGPHPIFVPDAAGFRVAPAGRHPAGDGEAVRRGDPRRRGPDRSRAAESELLLHYLPVRWTRRFAQCRSRQHRALVGADADYFDDADPADLGDVHAAAGQSADDHAGDGAAQTRCRGLCQRQHHRTRPRRVADARQYYRYHNRNDQAEGDVCQRA